MTTDISMGEARDEDEETELLDSERANRLFASLGDDPAARDELVLLYRPLAEYLARRFRGRGEPVEDLEQVASLALIKALDRFDLSRNVKFSTYATATIVGEIKRHFRDKGWALRVPRRLQEAGLNVSRAVSDLYQELGRSPTIGEIAGRTDLTNDEVLEALDTVHAYSAVSLDAPGDDDRPSSIQNLGSEDEALELTESWASVEPLLKSLQPREQRIIFLRFFQGLTQTQIAEKLNMSQMHVSRLLSRTLRELREALTTRE